jgi:hypothetical protein
LDEEQQAASWRPATADKLKRSSMNGKPIGSFRFPRPQLADYEGGFAHRVPLTGGRGVLLPPGNGPSPGGSYQRRRAGLARAYRARACRPGTRTDARFRRAG